MVITEAPQMIEAPQVTTTPQPIESPVPTATPALSTEKNGFLVMIDVGEQYKGNPEEDFLMATEEYQDTQYKELLMEQMVVQIDNFRQIYRNFQMMQYIYKNT